MLFYQCPVLCACANNWCIRTKTLVFLLLFSPLHNSPQDLLKNLGNEVFLCEAKVKNTFLSLAYASRCPILVFITAKLPS